MTYPPNQGPYGQQPGGYPYQQGQFPAQYPGQPPVGPPPKKNKTGLIIGLSALGLVVVVGAVLAIVLTNGSDEKAAAPPPSSSAVAPPPSSSAPSTGPSSASAPSGGGVPAADTAPLEILATHIQSNLNQKNVDGLLIKVCKPSENKEKARQDVLKKIPAMDPASPDHQRVWYFGLGVPSKASGTSYQISFQGSYTDAATTPISVVFRAYVEGGRATWCGVGTGG